MTPHVGTWPLVTCANPDQAASVLLMPFGSAHLCCWLSTPVLYQPCMDGAASADSTLPNGGCMFIHNVNISCAKSTCRKNKNIFTELYTCCHILLTPRPCQGIATGRHRTQLDACDMHEAAFCSIYLLTVFFISFIL